MKKSGQEPSFGQGLELANIAAKAIANSVKKNNTDSNKIQEIIGKPGVIFDFFENLLADNVEKISSITHLVESGLLIKKSKYSSFSKAKQIFKYIDDDFENWGLNRAGESTEKDPILSDVYKITKDGHFSEIFGSINRNLDELILPWEYIIGFCEQHHKSLRREGAATFFLVKENNEYFVVRIPVYSNGLHAHFRHFKEDGGCHSYDLYRVVVRQCKPLDS